MDPTHWLFYAVFLCQILLGSYHYPKKLLCRMQHVLAKYPPTEYPKLYPKSADYYQLWYAVYRNANRSTLGLGFVALFAVLFFGPQEDGTISQAWPAAYGLVQFAPLLGLSIGEFRRAQQMRAVNAASKRTAVLRRRRFFDVVPPGLALAAALAFAGTLAVDLLVHDFRPSWELWALLAATNLFMASFALWGFYGRKLDPHQSHEDRTRMAGASLRSTLYVSILVSAFLAFDALDDVFGLEFLEATLLSLYMQTTIVLSIGPIVRSLESDELDFSVYARETAPS